MSGVLVRLVGRLHIVAEGTAERWVFYHSKVNGAKDHYGKDNQSRQKYDLHHDACPDEQHFVPGIYTSFSKVKHGATPRYGQILDLPLWFYKGLIIPLAYFAAWQQRRSPLHPL